MRILFINHFPLTGSGSGVYTANLAKSLTRRGHEAAIIFSENRNDYELYEGVSHFPVFFKDKETIEGAECSEFNFPCFTSHPRSKSKFISLTDEERAEYEERYYKKISEVMDGFKPDIVHAQHVWVLAGIAARCCAKRDIPLVITCHGTDLMGIEQELEKGVCWGRRFVKEAVEYAYEIVTISRSNDDDMKKLIPEALPKAELIMNGVDTHVFYPDAEVKKSEVLESLGVSDYEHIVCYVGRLAAMKRVNVLLKAARIYEDDNTATLLAGDGDMRDELEQMSRDLKLKNTFFLGNQPHEVLHGLYNVADCSVIQSKKEPFGLVALEAMACGTPVVASDQGGLPEIVPPDRGILFLVDDHEAMARAIRRILDGEVLFDRQKTSAQIKEKYSQDVIISRFEELYEQAVREHK